MSSMVALRALPAQDRPVRATPAADLAREMITTPNERVAARWSSRGRALYDSSRYRESIASFELALKFGAGHPGDEAWSIARAYARLGNKKQALRWAGHALEMGCSCCDAVREDPRYRDIIKPRLMAIPQERAQRRWRDVIPQERAKRGSVGTYHPGAGASQRS
jgi:tetratricopeptide (TPR) repeat protein